MNITKYFQVVCWRLKRIIIFKSLFYMRPSTSLTAFSYVFCAILSEGTAQKIDRLKYQNGRYHH